MSKFWFAGGYYVDLDEYGQLRVAGPGNHLFCGLTLPHPFVISKIRQNKNRLRLDVSFTAHEILFNQPVMGDIRSVRSVTETPNKARPTFSDIQVLYPGQFKPTETVIRHGTSLKIVFIRKFSGYKYGFEMVLPKTATLVGRNEEYIISANSAITLTLNCFFDFPTTTVPIKRLISNGLLKNSFSVLTPEVQNLMERTEEEIDHLISYSKTSSFEYGTIFPRDWMESAELGVGDLSPTTIEEMYSQALKNVSATGEGWHEDVVGELADKYQREGIEVVDRRMIDIEPRYLLGMSRFSQGFYKKNDHLEKLRRVARYVIDQARPKHLITFKDPLIGNWRDSPGAFLNVPGKVAPFDVNAVFYPAALEKILQHNDLLKIREPDLEHLVDFWRKVPEMYRFSDESGVSGYALCIYGENKTLLPVHNTDEAYIYLYGWPTQADSVSFARRILDPNYFYTESGPLIVGRNEAYQRTEYHGEVIWPKQSALVVAALRRQLDRASYEEWSESDIEILKHALFRTAQNSINAFISLDSVPELYIDVEGKAERYDSQHVRDGQVSYIQLWSAVGFRRMLRELLYINLKYRQRTDFLSAH
jgi:hypothetical protein